MARLSSKDFESFNRAVVQLHATEHAREFPWQIHQSIRAIIDGDMVGVNWVDPRTSVSLGCRYFPDGVISEELNALGQSLMPVQSPMWLNCTDEARSAADFMSRRTWAQRDLFWAMRGVCLEEYMAFDVRLSRSLTLIVADLRGRYGTYTDVERLKLKLLGPHLRQVCRRLAVKNQLPPGAELIRRQVKIILNVEGRANDWPAGALRLLAAYGQSVVGGELPESIRVWFAAQRHALEQPSGVSPGAKPMFLRRPDHTLQVYLMPHFDGASYHLILREVESMAGGDRSWFARLGVTAREGEILRWVAEGKTNPEIAIILGISAGTVKRHLENVFPKLGVENRHAATLLVTQALAAEASR